MQTNNVFSNNNSPDQLDEEQLSPDVQLSRAIHTVMARGGSETINFSDSIFVQISKSNNPKHTKEVSTLPYIAPTRRGDKHMANHPATDTEKPQGDTLDSVIITFTNKETGEIYSIFANDLIGVSDSWDLNSEKIKEESAIQSSDNIYKDFNDKEIDNYEFTDTKPEDDVSKIKISETTREIVDSRAKLCITLNQSSSIQLPDGKSMRFTPKELQFEDNRRIACNISIEDTATGQSHNIYEERLTINGTGTETIGTMGDVYTGYEYYQKQDEKQKYNQGKNLDEMIRNSKQESKYEEMLFLASMRHEQIEKDEIKDRRRKEEIKNREKRRDLEDQEREHKYY